MPEYCPRDRCAWTSPDGKCHWPTYNCPWKEEKERAAEVLRQKQIAIAKVKAEARKKALLQVEDADMPKGIVRMADGRWAVSIIVGSRGKRRRYDLGTFDSLTEAKRVRIHAERNRKAGTLKKWLANAIKI